jgi:superfamily I DNA and/or RNA helicase
MDRHPEAEALLRIEEQLTTARAQGNGGGNRELSELYKTKQKLAARIESEIVQSADVICSTCIGAGASCVDDIRFPLVLVDECTQAPEPSVLVPLVKCLDRVVLVGDHRQLPPTITDRALQDSSLAISLFERVLDVCNPKHTEHSGVATRGEARSYSNAMGVAIDRLDTQYRMHPLISRWPNDTFYGGRLTDGVSAESRAPPPGFSWPLWSGGSGGGGERGLASVAFIPVKGAEGEDANSLHNVVEAERVVAVVTRLLEHGVAARDIGVITPYSAQVKLLRRLLATAESSGRRLPPGAGAALEVMSVDGYQGREKEVVVFSCVRSSSQGGIGFLADPRRLNVALTRARRGLVVIGNAETLSRDTNWANWLEFAKDSGIIVP